MLTSEYRKFTKNNALIDTIEIVSGDTVIRLCNSFGNFTFDGNLYYGRSFALNIDNRQPVLPINMSVEIVGVHQQLYDFAISKWGVIQNSTVTYRQFQREGGAQVGYELLTLLSQVAIVRGLVILRCMRELDTERLIPLYQADFDTFPFMRSLVTPNSKLVSRDF